MQAALPLTGVWTFVLTCLYGADLREQRSVHDCLLHLATLATVAGRVMQWPGERCNMRQAQLYCVMLHSSGEDPLAMPMGVLSLNVCVPSETVVAQVMVARRKNGGHCNVHSALLASACC